ncbi:MAG: haloalkane dehalogenase [Polyangiaceae bacterium]
MASENNKQFINVGPVRFAYVDRGEGAPMVFLHGNPTSSYLWRNVIAPLSGSYRCIAPDLIGMGDSDKLLSGAPDRYSFFEHQRYLDGFLEGLRFERPPLLVVHDWGSALGFDWARRHPERVRGIAFMEAIVGVRSWDNFPPAARELFQGLRSERGEAMVLEQNLFVEQLLPNSILRKLSTDEMDEYRRPFLAPGEARRPTLSWPRQLPIGGEPQEICELVERYAAFMASSEIPKLFVNAEPGRALVGALRERVRRWPNQREVTVPGLHFIQEDSPAEIAAAIADWAKDLP